MDVTSILQVMFVYNFFYHEELDPLVAGTLSFDHSFLPTLWASAQHLGGSRVIKSDLSFLSRPKYYHFIIYSSEIDEMTTRSESTRNRIPSDPIKSQHFAGLFDFRRCVYSSRFRPHLAPKFKASRAYFPRDAL